MRYLFLLLLFLLPGCTITEHDSTHLNLFYSGILFLCFLFSLLLSILKKEKALLSLALSSLFALLYLFNLFNPATIIFILIPLLFTYTFQSTPTVYRTRGVLKMTLRVLQGGGFIFAVISFFIPGAYALLMLQFFLVFAGIGMVGILNCILVSLKTTNQQGSRITSLTGFLLLFAAFISIFLKTLFRLPTPDLFPTGILLFCLLSLVNNLFLIPRGLEIRDSKEKKMATIGQMASSIVHDLKSTISVVPGLANIAAMPNIESGEREEILRIISESSKRVSDMCQNILAFSMGQDNLSIKAVSSPDFFNSVKKTLTALFTPNKIQLEYDIDYQGTLKIDPAKIRRVILNIATNAREAIEEAEIPDPWFKLHVYKEKKNLIIRASDNGPGINDKIIKTIFQPFSTYGKSYGFGLGMAIARDITRAHKGDISFDPGKDGGAVFFVRIPL